MVSYACGPKKLLVTSRCAVLHCAPLDSFRNAFDGYGRINELSEEREKTAPATSIELDDPRRGGRHR